MKTPDTIVYKILAAEQMKCYIRMNGDIDAIPCGQDPFMNIMKNVFIYNACSKMDDSFASKFNTFKEERIDGSSPTNMLTLAIFDVGNSISRLRGFQRSAVSRTLEMYPKKHVDLIQALISPCVLQVDEVPPGSDVKSQLSRKRANFVLKADIYDALRDWPVIPPSSERKSNAKIVEMAVTEDESIRLLMLRELNMIEIKMWDLANTMEADMTLGPSTPCAMFTSQRNALDSVHDMHRTVSVATREWDLLHPSIREELAARLRIILAAFSI